MLDEHFFRREAGRLLATLTRVLGVAQLALAEDVVQDTLATAVEVWAYRGIPENPSAWLMTAARNRAFSALRRERTQLKYAPEMKRASEGVEPLDGDPFLPAALADDELRMMFSCCAPRLSEEVQVSLILSLLCGFSVSEVASAFLVSPVAMEKRLTRGKKALAESKRLFELTSTDVASRLPAVQRALYLLFNEGYHGACAEKPVRAELCHEAIRLVRLLLTHPTSSTSETFALAALMHLDAARLPARLDEAGELNALFAQDRSRWDAALISEGIRLLEASASGEALSAYHLEAGIAATHAAASRPEETRWGEIVSLYDALMRVRPSPVVALNRAIALAEHEGPSRGLEALRAISDSERLSGYPFYWAAIGELELRSGDTGAAQEHFRTALGLARNDAERRFLERRIAACGTS